MAYNPERRGGTAGAEPASDYSLVFNATSDYMLLVRAEPDAVFRVVLVNNAYVTTLRALDPAVDRQTLEGLTISEFAEAVAIPRETFAALAANYARACSERRPITSEEEVGVKGSQFFLQSTYTPILDADGDCSHVLYVGRDITAQKRVEHELRALVSEREVLIKELFHRTRNNMNVISSLFAIYAEDATPEEMPLAVADVGEKVQAMSAVHGRLYRSSELYHLVLSDVVEDVVAIVQDEEASIGRPIEVTVDPAVQVSLEVAVPLAMVLQQILSTTMRHVAAGPIRVTGSIDSDNVIRMAVQAGGRQFDVSNDLRDRTGLRLIRDIVSTQLSGELSGPDNGAESGDERPSALWTLGLPAAPELATPS